MLDDFRVNRVLLLLTFLTVGFGKRFVYQRAGVFANRRVDVFGNGIKIHFDLLFTHFLDDIVDERNDLFDFLVRVKNTAEHNVFAHFVSARFDHHDRVGGTGNINVHLTLRALLGIGVDYVLSVNVAYDN